MAGTTFVSPDLADEFTDRYGIPVMTMYGAKEFSGAVAGWSKSLHSEWWQRKRGSVGRPLPETVCNALRAHASVLDASVFGRSDERLGQVPVAVVELVADAEPVPEEELRRFVRGQLTAYEVPVAIHTVPRLPRGAALKVDRRRLLEMVAEFEPLPVSS